MRALGSRAFSTWGGLGFVLAIFLGWPSITLRTYASEVLCAVINPLLEAVTLGEGGHAQLRPQPVSEVRNPGENVTADSALVLTMDGYEGEMMVGLSLRRDFYIPLAILLAFVLPAPLPLKRRFAAVALGLGLTFAFCFASLCTTSLWMLARLPAGRALSESVRALLDTAVGAFIMPPALHFFVPILIAVGALWCLSSQGQLFVQNARSDRG